MLKLPGRGALLRDEMPLSQKIHAEDGAIAVGRDLFILSEEGLDQKLKAQLDEIDRVINQRFESVKSPAAKERRQKFASEQVLISLASLGIPVGAALKILGSTAQFLVDLPKDMTILNTSKVREAIVDSIYALAESDYGVFQEKWGDRYARTYGDPLNRLKVRFHDGTTRDLSYGYLRNSLIPDMIERLLGTSYGDLAPVLTKSGATRMAEEIFQAVRGLDLYFIQYGTLLRLASDLAIQPPHPWLVKGSSWEGTVEYNLERAAFHESCLVQTYKERKLSKRRLHCEECIYHSCAAILSFYHMVIGAGDGASVGTLASILRILREEGTPAWSFSRIQQLPGDLDALGEDALAFGELLHKTAKLLPSKNSKTNLNLARMARKLQSVASRLIESRRQLEERVRGADAKIDAPAYFDAVWDSLSRVPGLKRGVSRKSFIEFRHAIDRALFRAVMPSVLFVPYGLPGDDKVVLRRRLKIACNSQAVKKRFSDTVVVVFSSLACIDAETEQLIQNYQTSVLRVLQVPADRLLHLKDSGDRASSLSEALNPLS